MKTGLVTFHAAHHYGAMLQAYALAKTAASIAGVCELIDYVRPHTLKTNKIIQKGLSPGVAAKNLHSLLHCGAFRRLHERFEAFMRETMPLGGKRYLTIDGLVSDPPACDSLLCGSDQIWNPEIFNDKRFDPAFFLTFAPNTRKIAYAPSFGSAKNFDEAELRGYLNAFSHLSAREESGAEIIQRITGRDAPVVLDPTLLLDRDEWGALAGKSAPGKPYLLCYFVSPPGPLAALAPDIKGRLGAGAIQLAGARRKTPGADKVVFDAGPREFLSLFQNAAFVLTNSFHGVAFSVLFQRPFYCGAGRGEDGRASRAGNLLAALGLTGRLASGGMPGSLDIDYGPVMERLHTGREHSLAYLKDALSGG